MVYSSGGMQLGSKTVRHELLKTLRCDIEHSTMVTSKFEMLYESDTQHCTVRRQSSKNHNAAQRKNKSAPDRPP